jgi:hypothetical protein
VGVEVGSGVGVEVGVGVGVAVGMGDGVGDGVGVYATHKTDTISVIIVCSPETLVIRSATVLSTGSLLGGPEI